MSETNVKTVLALFVRAQRRHLGFSPSRLERMLQLETGDVARLERQSLVCQRSRFVLAAWCGIESWLAEQEGVNSPFFCIDRGATGHA